MKFILSSVLRKISTFRKNKSSGNVLRLMKLALPHMNKIIPAAVFVLLLNISQLIKPFILKTVIDDFIVKHAVQKGLFSVAAISAIYFLVVLLSGLFSIMQVNLINKAGQEIVGTLRSKVMRTIQLLPLSYLDRTSSGRLITRATNDVEAISQMYSDVFLNLFRDVFLIAGIVYAMLAMDPGLAAVSFSVLPAMFIVVLVIKNKIKENFSDMKKIIGRINSFMAENISGMKIVQIFGAEKEKKAEFLDLNEEYFKTTLVQARLYSFLKPAADVFQSVSVAVLLWYGMHRLTGKTLQIGVLYAFTSYIRQLFAPIASLSDNYAAIQSALVSANRIFELLDEEKNLENLDEGINLENIRGKIEFKNVWFAYEKEDWVLKNVSFAIDEGSTAAIIGETGAGKTTIINLLNGFYKVGRGEILIDGININDISLSSLRSSISVVLQDVFLFAGDIRRNITLNDSISEAALEKAIELSCSREFIDSLPGGLDEPCMERGSAFSAGQKQLLAFARALARNPAIFILDEATANIDTHTEKLIQEAIGKAIKGRTTLIIAHRLSTIKNSDMILVMKNGELVEYGSHAEMVENSIHYKAMLKEN